MRRTENKPFGRTHQLRVANSPVPCQLFLTSPDFFSGFWFLSSLLLSGLVSFLLSLNSLYLFSSHCTLLVAGYSEHLLHCNFCTETFQKLFRTFCPGSAASWQSLGMASVCVAIYDGRLEGHLNGFFCGDYTMCSVRGQDARSAAGRSAVQMSGELLLQSS